MNGEYRNDNGKWSPCQIIRRGRIHTRVAVNAEDTFLVKTANVRESVVAPVQGRDIDLPNQRVVPDVPLQRLYCRLRKPTGTKKQKFDFLASAICPPNLSGSDFIAELFRRSVAQMNAYRNEMEGFYADRVARQKAGYRFANQLIIELDARNTFQIGGADIKMLDYEIYPLRTTKSVRENGKSARSKVSGTMDALFAVSRNGVTCPGIGEIKAKSEQVGVTFALVQALMNASLLISPSQFRRLKNQKRYVESFADLRCEPPVVDIVLLMEKDAERIDEDVALATQLRDDLQISLNDCIRSITFAEVDEHYQVQMFT